MQEIVAATVDAYCTNNPRTIQKMLDARAAIKWIDRVIAKRMAYIIGNHWENIASGPTLFLLDDDGEIVDAA